MTTEQKRIAIAEACGWRRSPFGLVKPESVELGTPPDYFTDLNAMHEAELSLTIDQLFAFRSNLAKIVRSYEREAVHATAAQRAEAFLLTIQK